METVIIGMSGGVDSSVAALLLKEKGYKVIGITFKMLDDFDPSDAIKIADSLNIEHHVIDITDTFKKEIIDNFIKDYHDGLTPNPCVICNKNIKFKLSFDILNKYNADYIATGHYAKIKDGKLYKSQDLNKDQSYFLCQIRKELLPKIIFPLEGLTKEEIRQIAKDNNLITANKKDSYDICFIKNKFQSFIKENLKTQIGNIINKETNKIIGQHNGLEYYTIGQRKGLDLGGNDNKLYVVDKDINNNILYVASDNQNKYLYSSKAYVKDFNNLTNERITECTCKFRYHQADIPCNVKYIDDNYIEVSYKEAKAVAIGQFCVLYKDNLCLGGGIIEKVE